MLVLFGRIKVHKVLTLSREQRAGHIREREGRGAYHLVATGMVEAGPDVRGTEPRVDRIPLQRASVKLQATVNHNPACIPGSKTKQ